MCDLFITRWRNKFGKFLLYISLTVGVFNHALSFSNQNKIVAVVNDAIVTEVDVQDRIKLLKLFNLISALQQKQATHSSSRIDLSIYQIIKEQLVLDVLIEDYLQDKMPTNMDEIIDSINLMENQNNLPKGYFKSTLLPANGISYESFKNFIKSNIVMSRFSSGLTRSLKPNKDDIIAEVMANPNNCKLNIVGYVIKYDPKFQSRAQSILSKIRDVKHVIQNVNSIPGAEVSKINYSLEQIKNSKIHGILMSLSENNYSKAVDVIENGVKKKQVVFLENITFKIDDNNIANQANFRIITSKSKLLINKFISNMKSAAIIIYK